MMRKFGAVSAAVLTAAVMTAMPVCAAQAGWKYNTETAAGTERTAFHTLTGAELEADEPEEKPQAKITGTSSYTKAFVKKGTFVLDARINSGAKLHYRSANKKLVQVSRKGKVKIRGYGETTITIRAGATKDYEAPEEKTVKIKIVPARMKWKYVRSRIKTRVDVEWKTNKTASGYQIQFSQSSGFRRKVFKQNVKVKGRGVYYNHFYWSGFTKGKTYYFRIRAYKKVGRKMYPGEWSSVRSVKIHS